ncbi:MAG: DNA replication/repair protein RecF [Akkermansiaceae bacterium]
MLKHLRLQNFRCFDSLAFEANPSGAIFIGENAQGKTSLLEAICILIRLQSPRTNRFNTLTKFDTQGFGVAGDPWEIERKIQQTQKSGLLLTSDGEKVHSRSAYLSNGGLVVWMGNEDLNLVRGPGESRRHFLDFLGVQLDPSYRTAITRYRRALKAKNLLLKEPTLRLAELLAYEEILVEHGGYLTEFRRKLVLELIPLVAAAQLAISGKNESLTLTYLPASGPSMRESILQSRQKETSRRQALVGPHRDDVSIRLHGMPASDYASEGQQRTIALALKLAQGDLLHQKTSKTPIYLLDDIFGELDPFRRNALLAHLPTHAQKFITTTHLDWMESSNYSSRQPVFEVSNRSVRMLKQN